MDMTEEQRLQIMRAMMGQGLLGETADISKLRPIWGQMNVESQMGGGAPLPQFEEWYQMMREKLMPQTPGFNPAGGM